MSIEQRDSPSNYLVEPTFTDLAYGVPTSFLVENGLRIPKLDLTENDFDHLESARQWAEEGNGLIVYFGPHIGNYDPIIVYNLVNDYIQPTHSGSYITAKLHRTNIDGIPYSFTKGGIVQGAAWRRNFGNRQRDYFVAATNDKLLGQLEGGSIFSAGRMTVESHRGAKKALNQHPGYVVEIAPEGTRVENGVMIRANKGVQELLHAGKGDKKIKAIGVAINDLSLTKFDLSVTQMISPEEAADMAAIHEWIDDDMGDFIESDWLMTLLLHDLPKRLHGVYDQNSWYSQSNIAF